MRKLCRFILAATLLLAPALRAMPVLRGVIVTPASTTPSVSANDTTIPSATTIVDSNLATWTVVGGVVYKDGAPAGFTSGVILLLYHSSTIYQENTSFNWWSWDGTTWQVASGGDPRGAAPVINSSLTAAGTVGTAFSYTITATNTPTSFSASGLPAGLSRSGAVISGTPTTAAVTNVTIGATNATSSDSKTLVLTINAAQAQSTKFVAAHWMIKIGITAGNGRALSDYKAALVQLYAAGVDVAIVYWDDFAQPSADFYQAGTHYAVGDVVRSAYGSNYTDFECIQATTGTQVPGPTVNTYTAYWRPSSLCYLQAMKASEELVAAGTPAAKIGWGLLGLQDTVGSDTEFLDFVILHRSSTGLFTDSQGRFIVSGYNNSWNSTYRAYLVSGGCSVAYCPDQWAGSYPNYASDAAAAGATVHFRFVRGGVWSESDWETSGTADLAAATTAHIGYMPGVSAFYAGNQNSAGPNFQMFETGGLSGLAAQINWCRTNDVPSFQFVTANDFIEMSNLLDFGSGGYISGQDADPNWTSSIVLSHAGFRPVAKHFATWYKTGTEPTVSTDKFVVCHPLCPGDFANYGDLSAGEKNTLDVWLPSAATAYNGSGGPRGYATERFKHISTMDIYDDKVEWGIFLASSATCTGTLGSSTTGAQVLAQGYNVLTIYGATTVSTGYGSKHRFTSAQWNNKPHLLVTRSGGSVIVFDGDSPATIRDQRQPVPGGANRLCWPLN